MIKGVRAAISGESSRERRLTSLRRGSGTFADAGLWRRLAQPRSWRRLISGGLSNLPLIADLLSFALAHEDRQLRADSVGRVLDRLFYKSLTGDVAGAEGDIKGLPGRLLAAHPWVRTQLAQTSHLGALTEPHEEGNRWQYALIICRTLLEMKRRYAGVRLGSLKIHDCKLTGLELAQSWALLTNVGHLFGTFATERALLFELRRRSGLRDAFLEGVCDALRPQAAEIIEKGQVSQFFYALAAWRISRAVDGDDSSEAELIRAVLL